MKEYLLMFNEKDFYGYYGQCEYSEGADHFTKTNNLALCCGYIYKVFSDNNLVDMFICVSHDTYMFYSIKAHKFVRINELYENEQYELLIDDRDLNNNGIYGDESNLCNNINLTYELYNCNFTITEKTYTAYNMDDIKAQMNEFGMNSDDVCNCIENKAYYNDIVEICHSRGIDVNDLETVLDKYIMIKRMLTNSNIDELIETSGKKNQYEFEKEVTDIYETLNDNNLSWEEAKKIIKK